MTLYFLIENVAEFLKDARVCNSCGKLPKFLILPNR